MLHTHEVEGSSPPVSTKIKIPILTDGDFYLVPMGTRKGGTSAHTGATKCPGDTLLARGRVLRLWDTSGTDADHNRIIGTFPNEWSFLFLQGMEGFENQLQQSGGLLLAASLMAATP